MLENPKTAIELMAEHAEKQAIIKPKHYRGKKANKQFYELPATLSRAKELTNFWTMMIFTALESGNAGEVMDFIAEAAYQNLHLRHRMCHDKNVINTSSGYACESFAISSRAPKTHKKAIILPLDPENVQSDIVIFDDHFDKGSTLSEFENVRLNSYRDGKDPMNRHLGKIINLAIRFDRLRQEAAVRPT